MAIITQEPDFEFETSLEEDKEKEFEEYAGWIHLMQAGLYYMAYRFHKKRGNKLYKTISQVGVGFHLWSTYKHWL